MDALAARRNVNARVEDAETLIVALTERCDQLLLAGKALTGQVNRLEDRVQALTEELDRSDHNHTDWIHRLQVRTVILDQSTIGDRLKWLFGIIHA